MLPLGRGTGGTTFVNSGTCFRTPPAVLARWSGEHGIDPIARRGLRARRGGDRRRRGDARAGRPQRRDDPPRRRAARLVGRLPAPQRASAAAARACAPSAARRAPSSTSARSTSRARWRRARRSSPARAPSGSSSAAAPPPAWRPRPRTAASRSAPTPWSSPPAPIHTPLLLARSGLGGGSGALGRHLTVHPATAVWGVFDEPVDMSRGVPQSYYVDEFAADGFVFEGIAGPPDYLALAAPFAGDALRELMLGHRHVAQCGLMISDRSRGRVASVLGRPARPLRPRRPRHRDLPRRPAAADGADVGRRRAPGDPPRRPRPRAARRRLGPAARPRPAAARPEADGLPPARHGARARGPGARRRRRATWPCTASAACTSPTAPRSPARSA